MLTPAKIDVMLSLIEYTSCACFASLHMRFPTAAAHAAAIAHEVTAVAARSVDDRLAAGSDRLRTSSSLEADIQAAPASTMANGSDMAEPITLEASKISTGLSNAPGARDVRIAVATALMLARIRGVDVEQTGRPRRACQPQQHRDDPSSHPYLVPIVRSHCSARDGLKCLVYVVFPTLPSICVICTHHSHTRLHSCHAPAGRSMVHAVDGLTSHHDQYGFGCCDGLRGRCGLPGARR